MFVIVYLKDGTQRLVNVRHIVLVTPVASDKKMGILSLSTGALLEVVESHTSGFSHLMKEIYAKGMGLS
jgi:hypothetical protein